MHICNKFLGNNLINKWIFTCMSEWMKSWQGLMYLIIAEKFMRKMSSVVVIYMK